MLLYECHMWNLFSFCFKIHVLNRLTLKGLQFFFFFLFFGEMKGLYFIPCGSRITFWLITHPLLSSIVKRRVLRKGCSKILEQTGPSQPGSGMSLDQIRLLSLRPNPAWPENELGWDPISLDKTQVKVENPNFMKKKLKLYIILNNYIYLTHLLHIFKILNIWSPYFQVFRPTKKVQPNPSVQKIYMNQIHALL